MPNLHKKSRTVSNAAQYVMHVALPAFTVNNQSSDKGFFVSLMSVRPQKAFRGRKSLRGHYESIFCICMYKALAKI